MAMAYTNQPVAGPLYPRDLALGDIFIVAAASSQPYTTCGLPAAGSDGTLTIAVEETDQPLHLSPLSLLLPLRMVRTLALACLVCERPQEFDIDLSDVGPPEKVLCDLCVDQIVQNQT